MYLGVVGVGGGGRLGSGGARAECCVPTYTCRVSDKATHTDKRTWSLTTICYDDQKPKRWRDGTKDKRMSETERLRRMRDFKSL